MCSQGKRPAQSTEPGRTRQEWTRGRPGQLERDQALVGLGDGRTGPCPGMILACPDAKERSWKCMCMHAQLLHSCPTLCDSMDGGPPGSSVHRFSRQEN